MLERHNEKEARTANTGFASGGVTCKLEALCFYSSAVQVDSFVLRNPPERKARKRQAVKKLLIFKNC
jgi:hypothetical protein